MPQKVAILTIAHTSRDPGVWMKRVDDELDN
jgi:hypothetical protein